MTGAFKNITMPHVQRRVGEFPRALGSFGEFRGVSGSFGELRGGRKGESCGFGELQGGKLGFACALGVLGPGKVARLAMAGRTCGEGGFWFCARGANCLPVRCRDPPGKEGCAAWEVGFWALAGRLPSMEGAKTRRESRTYIQAGRDLPRSPPHQRPCKTGFLRETGFLRFDTEVTPESDTVTIPVGNQSPPNQP